MHYIHSKLRKPTSVPKNSALYMAIFLLLLFGSCRSSDNSIPVSSAIFDSAILSAEKLYDSGKKVEALQFIRDAFSHSKHLNIQDEMNYYSYCNTIFMTDLKEYDRSLEMGDSMIWAMEEQGMLQKMPIRHVQALNIKADALLAKGLYTEAYDMYYSAKELAKQNGDSCSFSRYSYSLGMVSFRQQKFYNAANHFKQAYKETNFCVDDFTYFYLKQELLDNIGLSFARAKQYDSADLYYRKALSLIAANTGRFPHKEKKVYESAEAVVYGNIADIHIAMGNYDTAEYLLTKSINVNLQKGYTNTDAQVAQIKLAKLYAATNKVKELKIVLDLVHAELDTIPNATVEKDWNMLMWKYYEHLHDYSSAFPYVVSYVDLLDSFQEKNKWLMNADIEGRMKGLERQYQSQYKISMLEKDKKQQQIYLVVAIVLAVMAVSILFLLMRNASRAQKLSLIHI